MGTLLGLAVAPGLFLLSYLYLRDRYEREPLGLVLRCFLLGALAVVPVLLVDLAVAMPLGRALGYAERGFWAAFVVAGLVEEAGKLAATCLAAYRRPEWNERFDGVVYAGAAALGFATLENILYVFDHGVGIGVLRALLSVPGHALFGITMGYYLGLAKVAATPGRRTLAGLAALAVPAVLHGAFDQFLFLTPQYPLLFVAFLLFDILLWLQAVRMIRRVDAASPFRPPARRSGAGGE